VAALWACTVTVSVSDWLVREVWSAVTPLAVLESLLNLWPGKWGECVKNHGPYKTIDLVNNHAK